MLCSDLVLSLLDGSSKYKSAFKSCFLFRSTLRVLHLLEWNEENHSFLSLQFLSCSRLLTDPRSHSNQPTPEEQSSSGIKPPSSVSCCAQAQIIRCSNTCNHGWICTSSNERKKKKILRDSSFCGADRCCSQLFKHEKKGGKRAIS